MGKHDFFRLMGSVKESLARDYERIRARSREDPGTAGDQAEEDWASILREWLPAIYPIVTKGRILFPDQTSSPQLDLLVLKPSYPIGLRGEKYYFSGGVIAAFECKLTVRPEHVRKAFQTAAQIKRKLKPTTGTPYDELCSRPIFGLLGHSHEFSGRDPVHTFYRTIQKYQTKFAEHPRELPDIFCVGNAATVPLGISIVARAELDKDELSGLEDFEDSFLIDTMYVIHDEDSVLEIDRTGEILAGLVNDITLRIAYEDSSIRDWADHLSNLGFYGGIGLPLYWKEEILSAGVRRSLKSKLDKAGRWSKWSKHLP